MQLSDDINQYIKAGFILQNTTFSAFCLDKSIEPTNAKKALNGTWTGEKAQKISDMLITESKAKELSALIKANAETFEGGAHES